MTKLRISRYSPEGETRYYLLYDDRLTGYKCIFLGRSGFFQKEQENQKYLTEFKSVRELLSFLKKKHTFYRKKNTVVSITSELKIEDNMLRT